MKFFKSDLIKTIIFGIVIFGIGLSIGYFVNSSSIASLEGYLFNAVGDSEDVCVLTVKEHCDASCDSEWNCQACYSTYGGATSCYLTATSSNATSADATSSNATSADATSSNATSADATSSNATSADATSSNATSADATSSNATSADIDPNYNKLFLSSFSLNKSVANIGDRVGVNIVTTGAINTGVTVNFLSKEGYSFTTQVIFGESPYIIIPNNVLNGQYRVNSILLYGKNSDGTIFTKYAGNVGNDASFYDIVIDLNIINNNASDDFKVEKINMIKDVIKTGELVEIEFVANKKVTGGRLLFGNSTDTFTSYIVLTDGKYYFNVPSSTKSGSYKLDGIIVESNSEIAAYGSFGKKMNFEINLTVESNEDNHSYNNEDINNKILVDINNFESGSDISVTTTSNSIVSSELFDAIKGQNKKLVLNYNGNELVFNGKSVNNSKTIDASMDVSTIDNSMNVSNFIKNGVVVSFADNGLLPGTALVRIKANNDIDSVLTNRKVNVYYYNEQYSNFTEIAKELQKTDDGYYEFSITHNSSYVLTSYNLDESLIVSVEDIPENVVSFQRGNMFNILVIGVGILIVLAVSILVVMLNKKKAD